MRDPHTHDDIEDKRGRLAALLAASGGKEGSRTGPVSFAQRRLWILDRLVPGSSAYNVPIVLRTRTAPDPEAFGRALAEVVRRHEVLRTVFAGADGVPVQRVRPPAAPQVAVRDVGAEPDPAAAADALVRDFVRQPFDLAAGPLLRVLLVRVGEQDHLIALTVHHIVCDGWSIVTLFRELDALYRQERTGEPAGLRPVERQYLDFARWQRARLSGERLQELNAYWRERLEGAPGLLQLPLDAARPVHHRANGGVREFRFAPGLRERVLDFAAQERTTPFVVVLACFSALLQRFTGQGDVVVGVPAAGQTHGALQDMIGFFVNTLVMRLDLTGEPGLREAAARARETSVGAVAHQDMPFEKLVVELQPDRNPTVTPIFQVLFNFQTASDDRVRLPGLDADLVPFDTGIVRFDLEFNVFVGEREMGGTWLYNRDLFPAAAIDRLAVLLERLLAAAVAAPDTPLASLDLFTPEDLAELGRIGGGAEPLAALPARPAPAGSAARIGGGDRTGPDPLPALPDPAAEPALRHAVDRRRHAFDLPPEAPVLIAAAPGEIAPDEALWVLEAGGDLLVPDPERPLPEAVLHALATEDIDTLRVAPAVLNEVLHAVERGVLSPKPRRILVGDEPLGLALERRCLRLLPDTELWTVHRAAGVGDIAVRRCTGDAPAGHDLAGVVDRALAVRIKDAAGRLVPVGAPGRIWVARGADRADERPSGSLGRFREDGLLEVLGPEDEQIHVRQVRIPRGEIEETLAAHRAIGDARVVAGHAPDGSPLLTAHLTPADGEAGAGTGEWADPGALRDSVRAHAQRLLPGVLVPHAYVFHAALPLTPAGTADRAALAATAPVEENRPAYVAPRDDTERVLTDIWRSVLGVEQIGVHDNFFLLGGHSLLAIQLMTRIRRATRVDLPVSVLFRYRTVADLAARVTSVVGGDSTDGSLVRMQSGSAPLPVVAVHPAGGGVFCYGPLATALTNRTVYAFEGRHPGESLTALAERYLERLSGELAEGPFALLGWSFGGVVAFEMARLLAERGAPVPPLIMIDSFLFEGDIADPRAETRILEGYLEGVRADFDLDLRIEAPDRLAPRRIFADLLERLGSDAPEVLDLEEMSRQYAVYRSHILNLAAYRPHGPLPGPVHLIKAERSPERIDTWHEFAPRLTVDRVDGDHYDIMRNPGLTAVAARVERILSDAMAEKGEQR
ncbi:condensation domain-containing protein [Streptomyces sp. NPDC015171]|uniref:condensation domain-containing protein n=1 Tax=Streptomyces sp. NPDC015171 TaxID=3364945 RepID=UPI0037000E60